MLTPADTVFDLNPRYDARSARPHECATHCTMRIRSATPHCQDRWCWTATTANPSEQGPFKQNPNLSSALLRPYNCAAIPSHFAHSGQVGAGSTDPGLISRPAYDRNAEYSTSQNTCTHCGFNTEPGCASETPPNDFNLVQNAAYVQEADDLSDLENFLEAVNDANAPEQDSLLETGTGSRLFANEISIREQALIVQEGITARAADARAGLSGSAWSGSDVTWRSSQYGDLSNLSAEDRALLQLRTGDRQPWKETARLLGANFGKEFSVPAIQMKYRRLQSRARGWTAADEALLKRAHAYWRQQKWHLIAEKMVEIAKCEEHGSGLDEPWPAKSCAEKWEALSSDVEAM